MVDGGDNVVWLNTDGDIPIDRVLFGAFDAKLEFVFVIGRGVDGELYMASSTGDAASLLLVLKLAEKQLLEDAQ
jgi:hypothetical protein